MTRRGTRAAIVLAAGMVAASALSGAAAAPVAAAFCLPIPGIWDCDEEPSPTPTSAPSPSESGGIVPDLPLPGESAAPRPDDPETPSPTPTPAEPVADDEAPVFTQPPAQLGSDSLSIRGLKGISLVTVPLADGSETEALKISADHITITGFALTVTPGQSHPALVTTADTMDLDGDVQVYLNSLTATTQDGEALTLGADTPPPEDGIEPKLLRVTFGLVGTVADSITYSNTDQRIVE